MPIPGYDNQNPVEIRPNNSGLPPDAPEGATIVPNNDKVTTDATGRVVQTPSAIRPAATPERTGQRVPRGPSGGYARRGGGL